MKKETKKLLSMAYIGFEEQPPRKSKTKIKNKILESKGNKRQIQFESCYVTEFNYN